MSAVFQRLALSHGATVCAVAATFYVVDELMWRIPALIILGAAGLWLCWRVSLRPLHDAQTVLSGYLTPSSRPDAAHNWAALHEGIVSLGDAQRACEALLAQSEQRAVELRETALQAQAAGERAKRTESIRGEAMLSAGASLETVAGTIQAAMGEVQREAREVGGGAEEQKTLIAETALAMEDMLGSIMGVAESASQAASASEEAGSQARRGADIVNTSVEAIGRVSALTTTLKIEMTDLGTQAEAIGQVMTVISDIADQTNLLALNAAIEAARAGDAGRGFAVVADEVRKLAEKTMRATQEVGSVIQAIQHSARDNIGNMETAAEAVLTATSLAEQSRRALGEIVTLADTTSVKVRAIAASSEAQVRGSEGIKGAIDRIHDVSAQTTEGMQRTTQTMSRLGGEIAELLHLNGVFKLIGQGTAQELVEGLAESTSLRSLQQTEMEKAMRSSLAAHAFLELLYATDARGRQLTENIAPPNFKGAAGKSAKGRDWSSRPWFAVVQASRETYISPIYVSEASGEYCLTISSPIMDDGQFVGVVAADIKVYA